MGYCGLGSGIGPLRRRFITLTYKLSLVRKAESIDFDLYYSTNKHNVMNGERGTRESTSLFVCTRAEGVAI